MAIADTNSAGDSPFWLNLAAEQVYGSGEKRENSVKGLTTVILWTFGLFASGGMLSIFGGIKELDFWALVSFGIAFFFLSLAYMLANRALYPVAKELNPAEVSSVKKAFSEAVIKQTERFKWAAGFTAMGFFFLAGGILLAFWTAKKTCTEKPVTQLYVKTGVEKINDTAFIPVTILNKEKSTVVLSFFDTDVKKDSLIKDTLLYSGIYYTDSTGRFYYSYKVNNKNVKNVRVRATVSQAIDVLFEQTRTVNLKIPQ